MSAGGTGDRATGATVWRLHIDTGGTFTDCVALDPGGGEHRVKILSSSAIRGVVTEVAEARRVRVSFSVDMPADFLRGARLFGLGDDSGVLIAGSSSEGVLRLTMPSPLELGAHCEVRTGEEAPVLMARLVTGTAAGAALPPIAMRLATTRATNALLERSGAPTALFITRGLGDLLEIGTQQRPDLFALEIRRPEPLYSIVVEVEERLNAQGETEIDVASDALEEAARRVLASGIQSAAVALMHSYRNDTHERRVREVLEDCGFRYISCSADLAPFIRLLPRAETAVVNAYLSPIIESYLEAVREALCGGSIRVMTSAGGLTSADRFQPKESLLSGPAGGVVGAARAALLSGVRRIISFDMGGTSTDVARVDGDYEYQFETRVGEARILAPALAIETIAAGGGSICRFDGRQLKVGPESAGASPGPACYGAGGPLTLTDVNLLLGRLDPYRFEIPLSAGCSERAAATLEEELRQAGSPLTQDEMLLGLLAIADERMAEVIRRISVRKGYDVTEYSLVAFGGAGAQHAVAVARRLGIRRVIVPPDASLLSAWGLGYALVERFAERQILEPASIFQDRAGEVLAELEEEARREVVRQGVAAGEVRVRRRMVAARLMGQESTLELDLAPESSILEAFESAYLDRFGYAAPDREVEVESVRVVVSTRPPKKPESHSVERRSTECTESRRCHLNGSWRRVPLHDRSALPPGSTFAGPALVFERFSATVVEAGWRCRVDGAGALILDRRDL